MNHKDRIRTIGWLIRLPRRRALRFVMGRPELFGLFRDAVRAAGIVRWYRARSLLKAVLGILPDLVRSGRLAEDSLVQELTGLPLDDLARSMALAPRRYGVASRNDAATSAAAAVVWGDMRRMQDIVRRRVHGLFRGRGLDVESLVQDAWVSLWKAYWSDEGEPSDEDGRVENRHRGRYLGGLSLLDFWVETARRRGLRELERAARRQTVSLSALPDGYDLPDDAGDRREMDDSRLARMIRWIFQGDLPQSLRIHVEPGELGGLLARHGQSLAFWKAVAPLADLQALAASLYHRFGFSGDDLKGVLNETTGRRRSDPAVSQLLRRAWVGLGHSPELIGALRDIESGRS